MVSWSLIKHEKNRVIQTDLVPPDLGAALLNIKGLALLLDPDLRRGGCLALFSLLLALLLLVALHLVSQAAAGPGSWLPDDHQWPSSNLDNLLEPEVREETDEDRPRQGKRRQDDGNTPVLAVDALDGERATTDEHDHDLAGDHDNGDGDEEVVVLHTGEDVELVVEAAVVELVEDLHPDEGVEDDGADLGSVELIAED